MAITASMVKELREMTGAGMMDCKKALDRYMMVIWTRLLNGLERMVLLRLRKKSGRIAAEGIVADNTSVKMERQPLSLK